MISIAHPDFRDELFYEAKKMGLFSSERTLTDSIHGVYPVRLEEVRKIAGETVTIRPAKPVDERRIQEHYYNLDKSDVVSRFFHEKTTFVRNQVEGISQIDYIKNLSILAVVGEFGFGKVVAVGEYLIDDSKNMAEVAFSVNREWQGKGMARILIQKLAEAARENGIYGLIAYTSHDNVAMINLFKTLPYKVKTTFDEDVLVLSCKFSEPKESK
jgi:GNAT superfamily N-acetyltransferase